MKQHILKLIAVVLCAASLAGCAQSAPQLNAGAFVTDITTLTVPDSVRIVALGEASHGASELQQLKADTFKALVANNGCRVFAIEGDFGGCAKVDAYIHGGAGTAEEAVSEIGFRIYNTQELADLAQWMRTYNETAAEDETLHFVGFDMQRYDNNKSFLLDYLTESAPALAATYTEKFSALTDETMYNLSNTVLADAQSDIETLLLAMQSEIPQEQQDGAFAFALQCAQSMLENTQLRRNSTQYNELRDAAMKQKVDWICDQYDGLIFINGHNGHIAKVSTLNYTCMGEQLAETYGDAYFPIGTDVERCEFNGQSGDGYKVFTVKNENVLTAQLASISENMYYLDFASVANDAAWQTVLSEPQTMLGLNVSFSSWQKLLKMTHTMSMTPQTSYNGVIVLKTTTPTHLL